jgi:hypothetical protein
MYDLLISHLSRHSIPFPYRICINSVQFTRSNAFCQSIKHAHNSSSVSRVHSDTILSISITSPGPLPVLFPNCSYPCTSSIFLSILRLSILAIIYGVCVMRLILPLSLHFFLSFWLLLLNNHCNFSEILGSPSSFTCVVDQSCQYSETIFSHLPRSFLTKVSPSSFCYISFCVQLFSL